MCKTILALVYLKKRLRLLYTNSALAQNSFAINKKIAVLIEKIHVFDFEIKRKLRNMKENITDSAIESKSTLKSVLKGENQRLQEKSVNNLMETRFEREKGGYHKERSCIERSARKQRKHANRR